MALQLKASRELLSLGSSLFSNNATNNKLVFERLIEASHILVNADRVYLFEIDPTGKELVVKFSRDHQAIGLRIPVNTGIEGAFIFILVCGQSNVFLETAV
jgi:hypothetical protein